MSTEKIHTARVASWPSVVGDLADCEAALKARDAIRRRIEDEAYTAGATQVRILGAWDKLADHYPLDTRRFNVPVDGKAWFPSKSAPGGSRVGTVIERTETRALIAYNFKNRAAKPKWVPMRFIRPVKW